MLDHSVDLIELLLHLIYFGEVLVKVLQFGFTGIEGLTLIDGSHQKVLAFFRIDLDKSGIRVPSRFLLQRANLQVKS